MMNHNNFVKKVYFYLGNKYDCNGMPVKYKDKEHKHILFIPDDKTKDEVVKESNLLPEIKNLPFILSKLHRFAHHLNSSQIMCYNFFRRFIDDNGKPSEELINILRNYCPLLEYKKDDAKCEFEYIEKRASEKTNFDFYLESGGIKVFCEIKYTEKSFSKSGGGKNPPNQYKTIYKPLIGKNDVFRKDEKITEEDVMDNYYQLFRNAVRAKTGENYVLFICPKDREDLKSNFEDFEEKFLKENEEMIQYVYWEDLISKSEQQKVDMNSFKEKYFGYK